MRRRGLPILVAWAILGGFSMVTWANPAKADSPPPNVVVIMTDDLDVNSLNTAAHPPCTDCSIMPNFVTFLETKGTTFTYNFVSDSLCCPSRATFFTGQYAHNHMVKSDWATNGACDAPGFNDQETIARWLHDASTPYYTGLIGKYLNGYGSNSPGSGGCRDPRYVPPHTWKEWHSVDDTAAHPESDYLDYWVSECTSSCDGGAPTASATEHKVFGTTTDWSQYQTTELGTMAYSFITSANRGSPFFLYVSPPAPHLGPTPPTQQCSDNWYSVTGKKSNTVPLPPSDQHLADSLSLPTGGSFNESNVSDKPPFMNNDTVNPPLSSGDSACTQTVWRTRLDSLKQVDYLIGQVALGLYNSGSLSNTIVIFTSDNGYYSGEHRLHEKIFPYEEGIRVPLVVRVPASLSQVTDSTHFVLNTDLAPTIADVASATIPGGSTFLGVDGQPFTRFLPGGGGGSWRYRFLVEHWANSNEGFPNIPDFFGVRTTPGSPDPTTQNGLYVDYTETPSDFIEYYGLDGAADPQEMSNCIVVSHSWCPGSSGLSNLAAYVAAFKPCNAQPLSGQYTCQALENHNMATPP